MSSGWSLEAWIQQALNCHVARGGNLSDFTAELRDSIYSEIDKLQSAEGLDRIVTDALCSTNKLSKAEWLKVAEFFDRHFSGSTVYRLARMLIEKSDQLPDCVITFNADTLFETIYNVLRKCHHNSGTDNWQDPPKMFARHVRSSQDMDGHIPIYHVHGCVPPTSIRHPHPVQNAENMVFPENSYAGLAGRVFTWAQNTFLHKAQTTTLCFVGLSMSDANIRRWLSWVFELYITDLVGAHKVRPSELSGRHVWVHSRQNLSGAARETYPFALRHLGVQICWLDDWDQLPDAMDSMLTG